MKTLHTCNDLTAYGVHPLTGEADAYSRRTLCDLSTEGIVLLTAYFGLSHTVEASRAFPANWNGYVGEAKAVASVLLAHTVMLDLMVYALLHVERFDFVYEEAGSLSGFNEEDTRAMDYYREAVSTRPGSRLHHNQAKKCRAPQVEDRHVHVMSGRVL
jgi:hypothetical protein